MKIAAITIAILFSAAAANAGEGHDAGYDWAQENEITDPDDCGGKSQSFIAGCEEAAEEAAQALEDEEEGEE